MAKQLTFEADAREAVRRGVEKMARAVKGTLGPRGRSVVVDRGWGSPLVTADGAAVAEEIELVDPYENAGAQLLKEAATKTSDESGDGTTTSVVLAEAIFLEGLRRVVAGADPISLQRGIQKATECVVGEIAKSSKPMGDNRQIEQLGTIASKGDASVGKMLSSALEKVGREGVITVEEGKSIETEIKIVEGMQFDRGFLSPHFVTHPDSVEVVLENPYILIFEDKISSAQKLIPLLEELVARKAAFVLIAEDVEGEALATLVVNRLRGVLQCAAVKAPGYGDRRKAMLEDIAIATGGKAIFKDLGVDLEKLPLADLGRAMRVKMTSEETTILEGRGDPAAVKAQAEQIRREIEETDSDYDREKLQERLAKLTGGVAQINVGAATESEMKEKKSRIEDALHAVRAAVEEGVVAGGGVALLRAAKALAELRLGGDEQQGAEIVRKALSAPLRQIAANAGADGAVVVAKVASSEGNWGYDAERRSFRDLWSAGILDPAKVVRVALQNAASVAGLLLTTECVVSELPEKEAGEEEEHAHQHSH